MDRKFKLIFLVTLTLMASIAIVLFTSQGKVEKKRKFTDEESKAIFRAQEIYRRDIENGVDLSSGPCLTNDLMPGWVADIVHNPRQSEDNLPHNQCAAYLERRADHFVELDLKGNVVRVQ